MNEYRRAYWRAFFRAFFGTAPKRKPVKHLTRDQIVRTAERAAVRETVYRAIRKL